MRVLVTGAEGFVGGRLVRRLIGDGHEVTAAIRPGTAAPPGVAAVRPFDLRNGDDVRAAAAGRFDAVVHLAAMASSMDARRDPGLAWDVNAAGTARLCSVVSAAEPPLPRFLLVSTAEVYGAAPARPRVESDATAPISPYAASKLGAEIAAGEVARRTGLPVVVARPFPHSGAGQDARFVVPAFARRIRDAMRDGRREVPVGNLDPVRDLLHVDDVVEAYVALIQRGTTGGCYNVASGSGLAIRDVFERLRVILGAEVAAVVDPGLARPTDIPYLVGDATRLSHDTGWRPRRTVDDVLDEVARAQTH